MLASKIPPGPGVREAKRLLEEHRDKGWIELALRYGRNFTYQGALATCDPDVIHMLLTHRPHTIQRSAVYRFASRIVPGASGVLFMDGEEWQQHVRAVMPVFTHANIDSYAEAIHTTVAASIDCWPDGKRFDNLYRVLTELGLHVVLRVGYGLDPDDPLAAAFGRELMEYKLATMASRARLDEFGLSIGQVGQLPQFVGLTLELRRRMARLCALVSQIRVRRTQERPKQINWVALLDQAGFGLRTITDELNHIYGAFNAIDYSLTCACYELSRRPERAELIALELQEALGERPFPTHVDFAALPHTTHFMREVFRYYPVAMAVARRTGEPLAVGDGVWPSDKEVLILIAALHFHPDLWDDPLTFKPERWEGPTPERGYIPFLVGPRRCIGQHLAELHFVITLNALLRRCRLDVLDHSVRIVPYLIPRFERPVPAIVRRSPERDPQ